LGIENQFSVASGQLSVETFSVPMGLTGLLQRVGELLRIPF
jgi:hypothetical protein